MTVRCFVDTNILIYSQDLDVPQKYHTARNWIDRLRRANALVLSAQSVVEYYGAARRRFRHASRPDLRRFAQSLLPLCRAPAGLAVAEQAWMIEDHTGYSWFDCLLLASAAASGCRFFVSEDLQHERAIESVTIINPFRTEPDAVLSAT
jgi:predicted nucleic acid-binding protein